MLIQVTLFNDEGEVKKRSELRLVAAAGSPTPVREEDSVSAFYAARDAVLLFNAEETLEVDR